MTIRSGSNLRVDALGHDVGAIVWTGNNQAMDVTDSATSHKITVPGYDFVIVVTVDTWINIGTIAVKAATAKTANQTFLVPAGYPLRVYVPDTFGRRMYKPTKYQDSVEDLYISVLRVGSSNGSMCIAQYLPAGARTAGATSTTTTTTTTTSSTTTT